MRRTTILALLLATTAGLAGSARAATDLPSNSWITYMGLDWAWAAPVSADALAVGAWPGGFYLSTYTEFGWRLPTVDELLLAPSAYRFLIPTGNVPFGEADPGSGTTGNGAPATMACAAGYFTGQVTWCDFDDGKNRYWAGLSDVQTYEQLVVRVSTAPVPIPAAGAGLPALLAGAGWLAWRRRTASPSI